MRLPCVAHICSTSQGRAFSAIDGLISGMVACSISQQPGKAPEKLRHALAVTLWGSCRIIDAPPPGPPRVGSSSSVCTRWALWHARPNPSSLSIAVYFAFALHRCPNTTPLVFCCDIALLRARVRSLFPRPPPNRCHARSPFPD